MKIIVLFFCCSNNRVTWRRVTCHVKISTTCVCIWGTIVCWRCVTRSRWGSSSCGPRCFPGAGVTRRRTLSFRATSNLTGAGFFLSLVWCVARFVYPSILSRHLPVLECPSHLNTPPPCLRHHLNCTATFHHAGPSSWHRKASGEFNAAALCKHSGLGLYVNLTWGWGGSCEECRWKCFFAEVPLPTALSIKSTEQ